MKKFMSILLGLLGAVLYALLFVVIVAIIELFLYVVAMGGILILWASFSMDSLPAAAQVQNNTAMVFYVTMAVSVVLAALSVYSDYRTRKLKALLGSVPQPGVSGRKPEEQESSPKR